MRAAKNTERLNRKQVVPKPRLPAKRAATGLYARSKKSIRRRDLQTRYYMNKLKSAAPWIEGQDVFLLRRFCQLELLGDRVYSALRDSEIVNGKGESKRLLKDFRQLVLAQASLANQLGLSPAARMAVRDSGSTPIDISEDVAQRAIAAGEPAEAKDDD